MKSIVQNARRPSGRLSRMLGVALVIAVGLFTAGTALAARMESVNYIYFDQNHNVIGQHAEFCNNYQYDGGASTGAYELIVTGGCGDLLYDCANVGGGIVCYYNGDQYLGVGAILAGNSGGTTIQAACDTTQACSFREPALLQNFGFTPVQTYP